MRDEHIFNILDNAAFADLSSAELKQINAHTPHCAECSRAFEAARVSSAMLRTHAAQAFEPSPFFEKRVMAALREQKAAKDVPLAALWRLWQSAGALVSGMAAMVLILVALTFFAPNASDGVTQASLYDDYDSVIFNEGNLDEDMTTDQVFDAIYSDSEESLVN